MTLTVVVGPPCAGKSTHVAENRTAGEVVVDFDALATALGSESSHDAPRAIREAAFSARAAAVDAILSDGLDAWIIHTRPPQGAVDRYAAAGASFVVLDPGLDECLSRSEGRPERSVQAIRDWYENPPELPTDAPKRAPFPSPQGGRDMKVKSVALDPKRVKAGPEDGLKDGEFIVYPSTFTRQPDAYGDVVAKGAFIDTIKTWQDSGNTLPGLYGHRMDDPDFFVAGASEMGEDEHGWWVKGEFDLESPKGAQVYRLVKGRRLNQLSFAYDVVDEAGVELDGGQKANELRKLNVYEFSFVPVGANQDTSVVAIKGIADGLKSAENTTALREARDAIDSVLSSIDGDGKSTQPGGNDQDKASREADAKSGASDEEPSVDDLLDSREWEKAKSSAPDEEPKSSRSADTFLAVISIAERD